MIVRASTHRALQRRYDRLLKDHLELQVQAMEQLALMRQITREMEAFKTKFTIKPAKIVDNPQVINLGDYRK